MGLGPSENCADYSKNNLPMEVRPVISAEQRWAANIAASTFVLKFVAYMHATHIQPLIRLYLRSAIDGEGWLLGL